jgi:hypothetical protein
MWDFLTTRPLTTFLFVVLPLVSLPVAVAVLARTRWPPAARVVAAVVTLAIGFGPLVALLIALATHPWD